MLEYRRWAALVVAVAGCGEGFDVDGTDEPIEQVSSAISFNGHDYLFFHQVASWDSAKAIACTGAGDGGKYALAQIQSPY
jgi:hypothetical protein